jgi:hypothetical protein
MVVNDVLAMMDEEEKKAAERPSGQFVPTFLRLKDKQKARVRPLFNLDGCVVLPMHNKFNKSNPKDSINAVCSSEIGLPCPHCQVAKDGDKALTATTTFMLPVYVAQLEEKNADGKWVPVTYKDSNDNDVFVSGLRIIELKRFGTINALLQSLRGLYREDEKHDIRQYGLVIERIGGNQNTTYTTLPKGPSAMPDDAKKLIPTQETVRQMVMVACLPVGASPATAEPPAKEKAADVDIEF